MRKITLAVILVLLILFLYAILNAESWESLTSRGSYVYYYDLDNIQHHSESTVENNKKAWKIYVQLILKQTYADKDLVNQYYQNYAAKDEVIAIPDYKISTIVINCSDKIIGVKSTTSYKKSGEIISHTNYDKIFYLYIPAGSIYKALYEKVC